MQDVTLASHFLAPQVNINQYKAFPSWTETMNRAKLRDKNKLEIANKLVNS